MEAIHFVEDFKQEGSGEMTIDFGRDRRHDVESKGARLQDLFLDTMRREIVDRLVE